MTIFRRPRPRWNGAYLTTQHKVPENGMQSARASLPKRHAGCEESGCEWFLLGKSGDDAGFPFNHPVGVQCGDFKGCMPCARPIEEKYPNGKVGRRLCGSCPPCKVGTSNCPCADRKHFLPDEQFDVKFNISTTGSSREVVPDEYIQTTGEGLETLNHIKTRGL